MVSCQLRSPRFTRNILNGQWQPVVATGNWALVVAVADHFAYVAHTIFNKVFIHILPNNDSSNNSPFTTFIFLLLHLYYFSAVSGNDSPSFISFVSAMLFLVCVSRDTCNGLAGCMRHAPVAPQTEKITCKWPPKMCGGRGVRTKRRCIITRIFLWHENEHLKVVATLLHRCRGA